MDRRFFCCFLFALVALGACRSGQGPGGSGALRSAADALARKDYAESEALFEKARAEAKSLEESGRADFGLAEVVLAQGQAERALPLLQHLPGNAQLSARLRLSAQEALGRALGVLNRKPEAIDAYRGFFLKIKQLTDVERMTLREPDAMLTPVYRLETRVGQSLGILYYETGQLDAAARTLQPIITSLASGTDQAQAYKILALAFREHEQLDQALEAFGHGYVVAPTNPPNLRCELLEAQADIYMRQDRLMSGLDSMLRMQRLCPAPATEAKIRPLLEKLTPEELQGLLKRYPHDPPGDQASLLLARAMAKQGDVKASLDLLRQAQSDFPNSAFLAELQEESKDLEMRLVVDARALGFVGPLSGKMAPIGKEVLAGAQQAIEEYNRQVPNEPFRLIPIDSGRGPGGDQEAIRTLAQQYRAIAIIGPVTTAGVQASEELIGQLQVPTISPTATGEGTKEANPFLYRAGLLQRQQLRKLADFSVRSLALRRFAVLYPNNKYGQAVLNEFAEAVQAYGGAIVGQSPYSPSASDFQGSILSIKDAQPEAVFIPGDATTVALLASQLAFYDVNPQAILGTNSLNSDEMAEINGKHVENLYFVDDFWKSSEQPLSRAFVDQYQQSFGSVPSRLAAEGYDTARLLLIKILEDGGRANRALLNRKLVALAGFDSVTGIRAFDAQGNALKELKVLGIRNGKIYQVE